jgi:hypothetical protein
LQLTPFNPFHVSHWPGSIVEPSAYDGAERLSIGFDLGRLSEKEKKLAIKRWCATLPGHQAVRWLNIWSHVTPPLFDAACSMLDLECLQIKWSNVKDISAIAQLKNLQYLFIGSSTKIDNIDPLAELANLKILHIENFKLISDFSPLQKLNSLQSLNVTGSMWSRQNVGSLEPFARMTWLDALTVDTANVESIRPLASLKNLRYLNVGNRLPMAQYAWLAAQLPQTRCRWFQPYLELTSTGIGRCPTCKQTTRVMLTGRGSKMLCTSCDAAKVQKHVVAFELAKTSAMIV